ncbi:response regulator transcription factor [Marinilabilia rubra]|uniref:Response regulator n=1 Tax=Marinilabilia rubra TaxID=2162893 RepID=A0A2U2BD62_9BACT|nr:response regulator [Marinilabilia rubra]PWE00967.1 response regulator [Marinilabilia rubra]
MANILICEDDRLIGRIIERKLLEDFHQVKLVENGDIAIRKLKEQVFQLVISDVMMPVNSGLDVINYLRNELRSDIPILVVSALSEEDNIQEAIKLGASDYVSKPFSVGALREKVGYLLKVPHCEPGH